MCSSSFLVVSCVSSMFPLLYKDGLLVPYVALVVLNLVFAYEAYLKYAQRNNLLTSLFALSLLGCVVLNVAHVIVPPSPRYPDIHPVLNALYSCGHFVIFLGYTHYLQFELPSSRFTKIKKK